MVLKLFDDDDNQDISKIEINQEFARRYEHNKRREDLDRLEELKKKGLVDGATDSESSSDEEDDDGLDDAKFLDAMIKVKQQDPSLKLPDTRLFESHSESESESSDEDEEQKKKKKKKKKGKEKIKKPMYLKDVIAKQVMESGPEYGEENGNEKKPKSYEEEQEEFRRAILDADPVPQDDDSFLIVKKTNAEEEEDDAGNGDNVEFQKKLNQLFGEEDEFLRDYISKKMWVDKGKEDEGLGDDLERLSEDEEALEKQEDYEREFNFRYEENAGDRVLGHARAVDGSIRKKPSARREQRRRKKERMEQAEFERKEELKRLKNVKRQEIIAKREKIKEIAGINGDETFAFDDDLDDDFNPEEHDKKMKDMFGEHYYNAEDADPDFGSDGDETALEKPNFEKEDELLGIPKDWDVCPSSKEFLAERERMLKRKGDAENEMQDEEDKHKKKKRKKELNAEEMEEIYKLDYEDTIGDLKTRFKYAKVKTNRYGLKPQELLVMDDSDLNQYVSLKKLATYRDDEYKVPNSKRYEQKMKNKLLLKGGNVDSHKTGNNKRKHGDRLASTSGVIEKENALVVESNTDADRESKRSRKKRRHEELKMSISRLKSYGKIPDKPKRKKSGAKDNQKH